MTAADLSPPETRDLRHSNSLADLAARIKPEHEAAAADFNSGLRHAMAAGELLIEAKANVPHGQWLPWLKDNCTMSERTAQAYMRVAHSLNNLDDTKAQRVADLSFRDALHSLAGTNQLAKQLTPENHGRALECVEQGDAETWRQAVQQARREDRLARVRQSLETPPSILPSPKGRKIRVARNAAKRQWMLVIGPKISRAELKEREQAARETAIVRELDQERAGLLNRAAALEAEAKALRQEVGLIDSAIDAEIGKAIGPMSSCTETYDFQADEEIDAELASLPQCELVDRLLAARGAAANGLAETNRGYWGDMRYMSWREINPGPGAWTGVGSSEWLEELFGSKASTCG